MNWLFMLGIILLKHVICEKSRISDLRLCADPKCEEPVSEGKTLLNYQSDDARILSFRSNVPVIIYSKSAGKNPTLWGVKIGDKRGYAPQGVIREFRVIRRDLKFEVPTEIFETSQNTIDIANNNTNSVDSALLPSDAVSEAFPSQTEPLSLDSKEASYSGFLIKGAYAEPQAANNIPDPNTVAKPYDIIDGTTFYGEEYSNVETSVPSTTAQPDIKPTIAIGIPEGSQEQNNFPDNHKTETFTEDSFSSKEPVINNEENDAEQNVFQSSTEKILEFFSGYLTEENAQEGKVNTREEKVDTHDDKVSDEMKPSPSYDQINISTYESTDTNMRVQNDSIQLTSGHNIESTKSDGSEYEGYSSRKLLEDQVFSDKVEETSSENISTSTDDNHAVVDEEEELEDDEGVEEDEYEDEEDISEEDEADDSVVSAAEQRTEIMNDKLPVDAGFEYQSIQQENSVPVTSTPYVKESISVDNTSSAVVDENVKQSTSDSAASSHLFPESSDVRNVKTETFNTPDANINNIDNTVNDISEIPQEILQGSEQKDDAVQFNTLSEVQKDTVETHYKIIEQQFVTDNPQHMKASSEQISIQQVGENTAEHILQPTSDTSSESISPYANNKQSVDEKVPVAGQDNFHASVSDYTGKLASDKISDNIQKDSGRMHMTVEESTKENINISNSDKIEEMNIIKKAEDKDISEVETQSSTEHVQDFITEPNWADSSDIIPPTNIGDISEVTTVEPVVSDIISSQPEESVHLNEYMVDSSPEVEGLSPDSIDSLENLGSENETPPAGLFTNIYDMIFGGSPTSKNNEDVSVSEIVSEDVKPEDDVLDFGMSSKTSEIIQETDKSAFRKDSFDKNELNGAASTYHATSLLGAEVDSQCSDLEKHLHSETEMPPEHFDFSSVLIDIQPPSVEMIVCVSITGVFVLVFTLGYYYLEKRSRDGTLISKLNGLEKELMMSSKECITLKDELKVTKEKLTNVEHVSLDSDTCVTDLQTELQECKASKLELEEQVTALEKELESATETGLELNKMVSELLASQQGSDSLIKSVQTLQEQLDSQQGTISIMNTSLAVKSLENEKLQSELSAANERIQQLEEEINKLNENLSNLSKERSECEAAMDGNMKALEAKFSETLEEKAAEISQLNQDRDCLQMTLEEVKQALSIKDAEVSVLQDCLKQLRTMEEEEAEGGDKLQALLDVGRLRAELKMAAVKNQASQEKLQGEEDARKLLEDHVKVISGEVERLRSNYEAAERDKVEAQTKLEVLSNYFKEKETQLQKELGLQEAMFSQKENDVMTTYERIKSLQNEVENYKSQNETLKKEILDQERSFKGQVSSLEKKAHENWVIARQAERKLEESRQDAAQLRNRLIIVEKNLANSFVQNGETMKISDRLPSESNGDLSASPLHISMQDSAASPLHYREGLPVSPPLIGPGQPLPPAPFMGLPPFMPPLPPPGAPFMPPPPPPLFPEDRRPPPVGRMSSPPPNRRYSPPSPSYDQSPPLSPPYRHSPHLENDSRYRHMSPPPHWENPVNSRSGFRPVPLPPLRRGSPRDSRGSALSSGHSSESLEKSGRNSGKV